MATKKRAIADRRKGGGLGRVKQAASKQKGKAQWLKLEDGDQLVVRVLDTGEDFKDAWCHRVPMESEDGKSTYHEDVPCLDQDDKGTKCPGCIAADELVWTERGLIRMDEVIVGDRVIGIDGRPDEVLDVRHKFDEVVKITTPATKMGLKLTTDHWCFVVPRGIAKSSLPLVEGTTGWLQFKNGDSQSLKPNLALSDITITQAGDIQVGDYWLYPVISDEDRVKDDFVSNEDVAWLCGLWVGDGWIKQGRYPREVGIAFDSLQPKFIEKAYRILQSMGYNPKSSQHKTRERSATINVYSVDLVGKLEKLFGHGAFNKALPMSALYWPRAIQEAFLDGYYDAEGVKTPGRSPETCTRSKRLAVGIYGMSVQVGSPSCITVGQHKGDVWQNRWWGSFAHHKNTPKGFFCEVDGQEFYWTPVSSIEEAGITKVVDLEVDRTESFVVSTGITHNCRDELDRRYKFWANVIVRDWEDDANGNKPTDTVMIWGQGITIAKRLDKLDARHDIGSRDIVVEREGSKMTDTRYELEWADEEAVPLSDNDKKLREKKHDVMRYCTPPSFDDFYLPARERNKDGDEEDKDVGKKSLSRGSAFKRRDKKDEDDEEKPARRTSSRSSKPSSKPKGLSGFGKKDGASEPKRTTVRRRPRP